MLDTDEFDQVGYINFLLNRSNDSCNETIYYHNWKDTLDSLNNYLKENTIPGKILNIELQFTNKTMSDSLNW